MHVSMESVIVMLRVGCPQYLYHMTEDKKIQVFSRLGLGVVKTLEDETEAGQFWHKHRKDT